MAVELEALEAYDARPGEEGDVDGRAPGRVPPAVLVDELAVDEETDAVVGDDAQSPGAVRQLEGRLRERGEVVGGDLRGRRAGPGEVERGVLDRNERGARSAAKPIRSSRGSFAAPVAKAGRVTWGASVARSSS